MKKLITLFLALLMLIPSAALGDVLADGWEGATLDELQDAQLQISNRISDMRAAAAADVERVELTGTGTSILSDVVIPFAPSRVILQCEGDATAKLTGGAYDYTFTASGYDASFFDKTGTFGLLVEGAGAWSFTVEPIMDGGTLPMSGTGPYVSDFFDLPAPMIVTIAADKGDMTAMLSNVIFQLHNQMKNMDLWGADTLSNAMISGSSEPVSLDVILQPVEGRTQYCISVNVKPGVSWSVTPKN